VQYSLLEVFPTTMNKKDVILKNIHQGGRTNMNVARRNVFLDSFQRSALQHEKKGIIASGFNWRNAKYFRLLT